jgi:hypothetical protein
MWAYSSSVNSDRQERLTTPSAWDDIIKLIATNSEVVCVHEKEACDALGFFRLEACLTVHPNTFDLFFNAENGYRGQYFISPHHGILGNRALIDAVAPAVLAGPGTDQFRHVRPEGSIGQFSAKAWLGEPGKHSCAKCTGDWSGDGGKDIANGIWENSILPNSTYGCTAPYLGKIRVFGGFINSNGDEFLSPDKWKRAQHIAECGWS